MKIKWKPKEWHRHEEERICYRFLWFPTTAYVCIGREENKETRWLCWVTVKERWERHKDWESRLNESLGSLATPGFVYGWSSVEFLDKVEE